uniref:Calpain_III domain-containing protein n=1 Tax=Rodentolepis nana TaxID=102285 RepID=A0A0R3TKB3_RODNA
LAFRHIRAGHRIRWVFSISELDIESGGSSPFPHVGYKEGMWVVCILPICEEVLPNNRVRRRQSGMLRVPLSTVSPLFELLATASIPGQSVISESANCSILSQSAISESATVHYFSLVRALSSLHLEVLNSLPVGYVGE